MPTPSGSLLNHLPAIFRTSDTTGHLRTVLLAFEHILLASSADDANEKNQLSLEEEVANVRPEVAGIGYGQLGRVNLGVLRERLVDERAPEKSNQHEPGSEVHLVCPPADCPAQCRKDANARCKRSDRMSARK